MTKHQSDATKEALGHRRRFDPTFKHEAVALSKRIGILQAAKGLDVSENSLRKWVQAMADRGSQAFVPIFQRTDANADILYRTLSGLATKLAIPLDEIKKLMGILP